MIKPKYSIINGRKFFYVYSRMEFQCAYCLFVQPTLAIRAKDGLIIGLDIKPKDEQHAQTCLQIRNKPII